MGSSSDLSREAILANVSGSKDISGAGPLAFPLEDSAAMSKARVEFGESVIKCSLSGGKGMVAWETVSSYGVLS